MGGLVAGCGFLALSSLSVSVWPSQVAASTDKRVRRRLARDPSKQSSCRWSRDAIPTTTAIHRRPTADGCGLLAVSMHGWACCQGACMLVAGYAGTSACIECAASVPFPANRRARIVRLRPHSLLRLLESPLSLADQLASIHLLAVSTLHLYIHLYSNTISPATMALPTLRTTFASSSRVTLHHLSFPARSLAYLRCGSSLAQHSSSQAYTPTPAYSGPVASSSSSKAKGGVKDMHAAPNPAPPAAPAKNEGTGEKKEPRRRVPLKSQRNAITMVSALHSMSYGDGS